MKIHKLEKANKGAAICRFNLELENVGLTIKDCAIMESGDRKWLNFPTKTYEKDGETKYFSYIWMDKEKKEALEKLVFIEAAKQLAALPDEESNTDEIPF